MKTENTPEGTLETWDAMEVAQGLKDGKIVLIDVRTTPEFMMEHVHGALFMPMSFFNPDTLPTQDGKRIVFHCGSGVRSERVARAYLAAGNDKIAHMGGGMAAWKQAGLPFTGTDMATGAPKQMNS